MKKATRPLILAFVALLGSAYAQAPLQVSPRNAKQNIGKYAQVCGVVRSTKYADQNRGKPTFLDLDEPFPDPVFTIVIWGDDRPNFGTPPPEEKYQGVRVCIVGTIIDGRTKKQRENDPTHTKPQIKAQNPDDIKISHPVKFSSH